MKTRNTNFFKSILVFALVIGSIMSAAPTIALAENNSQISPISEYYATYYGEAAFENFAMTSYAPAPSEVFYANTFVVAPDKGWNTVDEFYANNTGNAVFESSIVVATEASSSELFYANYYDALTVENTILASYGPAASEVFYANYFGNTPSAESFAIAADKGWNTVDEFYANNTGNAVFESSIVVATEASPSELFSANSYSNVTFD